MFNHRRKISAVSTVIRQASETLQIEDAQDKNKCKDFTIKVANTLEEREAVFQLGYQVYLDKGYIKENGSGRMIQNYDIDPSTIILIVKNKDNNIVGSVTLVFDGDSILPAEKIYSNELNILRQKNEKIVEISRLVIDPQYRNSKEILVLLFNYLYIYAYFVKKYTCLSIEVNPRHTTYYKTLLHFRPIGDEKPCPNVQSAPAILMYLPLHHGHSEVLRISKIKDAEKNNRSLYNFFLKPEQQSLVAQFLRKQASPLSMEEKIYFGFADSNIGQTVCT